MINGEIFGNVGDGAKPWTMTTSFGVLFHRFLSRFLKGLEYFVVISPKQLNNKFHPNYKLTIYFPGIVQSSICTSSKPHIQRFRRINTTCMRNKPFLFGE